jgi:hypothetical protein
MRYEYKLERDESGLTLLDGQVVNGTSQDVRTRAHIVSSHADWHPSRPWWLTGRVPASGSATSSPCRRRPRQQQLRALLFSGRIVYDITENWDVGVLGSTFRGQSGGNQYAYGVEVGRLLRQNLWLSAGYNWTGFEGDRDLNGYEYTQRCSCACASSSTKTCSAGTVRVTAIRPAEDNDDPRHRLSAAFPRPLSVRAGRLPADASPAQAGGPAHHRRSHPRGPRHLRSHPGRIKALNDAGRPIRDYHLSKAQCWLDVSFHEYTRNDRSDSRRALDESVTLISGMEQASAAAHGYAAGQRRAIFATTCGSACARSTARRASPARSRRGLRRGRAGACRQRVQPAAVAARQAVHPDRRGHGERCRSAGWQCPSPADVPVAPPVPLVANVLFEFDKDRSRDIRTYSLESLDRSLRASARKLNRARGTGRPRRPHGRAATTTTAACPNAARRPCASC